MGTHQNPFEDVVAKRGNVVSSDTSFFSRLLPNLLGSETASLLSEDFGREGLLLREDLDTNSVTRDERTPTHPREEEEEKNETNDDTRVESRAHAFVTCSSAKEERDNKECLYSRESDDDDDGPVRGRRMR